MRLVSELDPRGKRVLVRVDWNITLGKAIKIVDDTRIRRTLETIWWLREHGSKQIILMSHLGRPDGKVVPELSLEPVSKYASELVGEEIRFISELKQVGESEAPMVMLENLRFSSGEELNSPEFVVELSSLGEAYVNEAFGDSHREAASIVGVAGLLPAYAGFNLAREVETINRAVESPERPLVIVMGGAKVEDKLKLLEVISTKADTLLLGGKLANEYVERGVKLSGKASVIIPVEGSDLLDIGKETQKIFAGEIARAKTVIWNGPMGKVEEKQYQAGTHAIYEALVSNEPAEVLVGGGDTLAAIKDEGHLERIDWLSTGGGAMLKLLETGMLPGISALGGSAFGS